jgi:hypothetical protein
LNLCFFSALTVSFSVFPLVITETETYLSIRTLEMPSSFVLTRDFKQDDLFPIWLDSSCCADSANLSWRFGSDRNL